MILQDISCNVQRKLLKFLLGLLLFLSEPFKNDRPFCQIVEQRLDRAKDDNDVGRLDLDFVV